VFAVVVVLNAPAALEWRRGLMRIGGTLAGFLLAIPLVTLVDGNSVASLAIGLLLLLPGMLLVPVNYAAGVVFITAAVGMLFSAGGTIQDFISSRVADDAIGAGVVCGIGLLLWHTRREDWWRSARLMAGSLADAAGSSPPAQRRDELVMRALQLRTETVEAAALPMTTPASGAMWTYLAASEDLIRLLTGPSGQPVDDAVGLAGRLRVIEAQCLPTGASKPGVDVPPHSASTLAGEEVARMATAVAALHRQG
jgi:uncharacterized membrane protein YccC